ncbi:N-acetylglucosamine-6-phosphate deacetylase-like isoform X1 [Saccostrea echinata]|uniref:N-acetylglucosamine-6-phosphate deacetylase-like isoform X1 n=2 Tax=Saccostrea echinata TaxID=191078 RepID=UPI002A8339CD|nr:N-acetylglucosamine-6-phosphate deacetylase-like isoform X1 [Saccostrea echinata]
MEVKHTETNRGNKAIIVDGYVYRKINTLKNGNIVYICSVSKNCKKSLTTDSDGVNVVKSRNQHSCKNEPNERKAEARQLRVRLKKQTQDYIKSPAAVVKSELTRIEDSNLQDRDIRNASMALYRHRRKNLITVLESIAPPQAPLERVLTTSQSGEVKMSNLGRIFKYTNCRLIRGGDLITDDLWVRDGIIVNPEEIFFQEKVSADVVVDCKGAIICAGFIDVQINGAFGEDFSNTDNIEDCVSKVAFGILAHGVTSFCPTIVTSSGSTYKQVVPRVKKRNGSEEGAGILGLHLEGPFISKEKRGAHDVDLIQTFNNGMSDVTKIYGEDLSNVAIVTLAPELERSAEVIRELVSRGIKVSVGHSVANLIQGEEAVNSGATFITHLFNAMLPFHHRDPGLIGLLTSKRVPSDVPFYGVISDGIHTHPAALRIAYRVDQRGMVLVTDAISAMGLPEGEHRFGSQTMEIKGRRAVIKGTQTLCGSIATMDMCVQHLRKSTTCGTVKALEAATFHPAHFLGITDRKGTLDFGTDADFILLDDDLKVLATYIGGECVWSRQELE